MAFSKNESANDHIHKILTEKQSTLLDDSQQQLSENETETENDFEILSFALPFHFSSFHIEICYQAVPASEELSEKTGIPIYVTIHNFRI